MPADHTKTADPTIDHRLHELDALRGLASLAVVFLHFETLWRVDRASLHSYQWVLLGIARPFYSGAQSVMLFFVLSGFVLALPYIRGRSQPYPIYVVRRILRIYGPYLAALVLALAADQIWYKSVPRTQWTAGMWPGPVQLHSVLQHLVFIGYFDVGRYDFVIWSLIHEMRISVIFPFVVAAVLHRKPWIVAGTALLMSAAATAMMGKINQPWAYHLLWTAQYLALFLIGFLIAAKLGMIRAWWTKLNHAAKAIFILCSFVFYFQAERIATLLMTVWLHASMLRTTYILANWTVMMNWTAAAGACGIIVVAINVAGIKRILRTHIPQFFGRISYSLYLLHPIILLALAAECNGKFSKWVQLPIYLTLSFGLSYLFCVFIEETFIRLGRSLRSQSV